MALPCRCDKENPQCFRAGVPMTGAVFGYCKGLNVSAAESDALRDHWDKHYAEASAINPVINTTMIQRQGSAARLSRELDAWIAAGRQLVTQQQHDERKAICETCPHFKGGKCLQCGCSAESAPLLAKVLSLITGRGFRLPGMWWMPTKGCPLPEPKWLPIAQIPPG